MTIRKLQNSDAEKLELFLSGHAETSMFLRSNMKRVGLEYQDKSYYGDYFGALDGAGNIMGVIAHYENGNVMMQAQDPGILSALITVFQGVATRPIAGVLGAVDQANTVIDGLSLSNKDYTLNSAEGLYALDLNKLRMPENFDFSKARMVKATEDHKDILCTWNKAYDIEALGTEDNEDLDKRLESEAQSIIQNGDRWILMRDDTPVCMSGFNARLPDIVQIGPVWTPPEHRSHGYARALVAITLQQAKDEGIEKAILFTDNPAAAKAYKAIGFEEIGAYRLAFLKHPVALRPD